MKKLIILFTLLLASFALSANKFVIVLDAGHGGRDPGAIRGKIKEKDINLGVALELGRLIEANHKDIQVVYTRKKDVFVELKKRSELANKAKANLFISLHTNATAAKQTKLQGADTYILGLARSKENLEVAKRENSVILLEEDYTTKYEGFDPKSPESNIIFEFMTNKYLDQSLEFASLVQSNIKTVAKRIDRGVKQAGFLVLRESSMPSVLVELGFINNITESKYLNTTNGQKNMAKAIYAGFRKYKENFDLMQGETKPIKDSGENSRKDEIEYRIQFLISGKKLPENSPQFKGVNPVSYYIEDKIYKYTYGSSYNIEEIAKTQTELRGKFADSFVVKFKNGERIK